jgi:hypothetical protein
MTDLTTILATGSNNPSKQVSVDAWNALVNAVIQLQLYGGGSAPPITPTVAYRHIFSYGQSLCLGERSTPVQSTAQRFDAVSFVGGARPLDTIAAPDCYASFIPLVENTGGPSSATFYGGIGNPGETPVSGMCAAINERATDRDYVLIGSASGTGATPIASLDSGSVGYLRIMDEVAAAKSTADGEGQGYTVGAIAWLQGESDPGNAGYQALLQTLASDLNTDIKAITGQAADVPLVTYQTRSAGGGFDIGLQQLAAAEASALIHMACPTYMATFATSYGGDTVHLDGPGSELIGAYLGRAIIQIMEGTPFVPLSPTGISYSGTHIDVALYVPVGNAVIDTTILSDPGQYGFSVFNPADEPKAATVTIVGGNTVRLEIGEAIAAGWTVQYLNPAYVTRGNIRDQAGNTDKYDPTGRNYPLHNWLVAFEEVTV